MSSSRRWWGEVTASRTKEYLAGLVRELCKLPRETEWLEFKENNADPHIIGEYLSALSNAAALEGKANAYVLWGAPTSARLGARPFE